MHGLTIYWENALGYKGLVVQRAGSIVIHSLSTRFEIGGNISLIHLDTSLSLIWWTPTFPEADLTHSFWDT